MVRKKRGGGEVFREPLGGGSDFLGVCEGTIGCIWPSTGLIQDPLRVWFQQKKIWGLPKTSKMY